MGKRIVIMAGGTGGHVFPALAVAENLLEKGWQVSWLGTQKGLESRVIPEKGIQIDWISVTGVRGKGIISKICAVFMLLKACIQASKVLRKRKPNVVLGMGGFVAGPGGLMAKCLGIPLVIHEQNRVPGTTNRLLALLANRVLEAFPSSFKKSISAICTGNPLRQSFLDILESESLKINNELHLLVVGGSQGAQILNEIVPEAMNAYQEIGQISRPISIKHQTGSLMQAQVAERYKTLGLKAEAMAFIDNIESAYQWADVVICRAGAMTVSEVAAMGVPAIFVPLPSAIDDHQTANARYLTEAGAGFLLKQQDMTPVSLANTINEALKNLAVMSEAAQGCSRLDATEVVANYCMLEAGL